MGASRVESNMLEHLWGIRDLSNGSSAQTTGLSDDVIKRFCKMNPSGASILIHAIAEAVVAFDRLVAEFGIEYLVQDEATLVSSVQSEYINFYSAETINPFIHRSPRVSSSMMFDSSNAARINIKRTKHPMPTARYFFQECARSSRIRILRCMNQPIKKYEKPSVKNGPGIPV